MAKIIHLIPQKFRQHLYNLLSFARIKTNKERFLTISLISISSISLLLSILISLISHTNFFIILPATLILLFLAYYFIFSLKADTTSKFVESVLPDALQLMASNLRAGLTTDRALLLAARPEFGVLSDEINNIGKKITLGSDIIDALIEMTKKFKSDRLKKTFLLIVSGLRSGGELTDLLDHTAENLRHEKFLDEKVRTNVLMYVIFIFAAIGFGSPLLFGLSSFLVGVLAKNLSLIEIPETAATALPISLSTITVSPSFILIFSLISLITSSILGSLVLGLISKGKEKYGLKFMPILIFSTITIFFLTRFLIGKMLGGLFGLE